MEIIKDGKIYKIKCPKCKCTFGYSEKDKYKVFVKETVQFALINYYIDSYYDYVKCPKCKNHIKI